ncbi:ECF transporter S component [Metasolibacillus meyeri]|uniref:ECF transporter S component n=1 Tax=Metasolibacillus meyeri TaxID=1071052 RepID=A0AAW9NUM2_9BACL|nr:ECF transporter S component [Metasolibacillus meyeri]MEC1179983.1 ECF transporter S component [Metasolibacillus meyeri]
MAKENLRYLVLTALLAALCAVGGLVKIPVSATASAALDSAPALLAAFVLPPVLAGFTGALGHMATAMSSGMPFGALHFIVAFEMFFIILVFAHLHKKGFHKLKWAWMLIANGVLAAVPFYFLISPAFYIAAVPGLVLATAINIAVAFVCVPALQRVKKMVKS